MARKDPIEAPVELGMNRNPATGTATLGLGRQLPARRSAAVPATASPAFSGVVTAPAVIPLVARPGREVPTAGKAPDRRPGPDETPAGATRELFLDALRAIALVRVMLWHIFGVAAITYVAAMPVMFFVTGSLLAKSLGRRQARSVLLDRFRRLLVPLWAFGVVAWLAMAVAAQRTGSDLPLHRALSWIFPLTDPQGSAWEGGWLSSHLWYLRTLTWLLLASPLLLRAVRALRGFAVVVPLAAVFVFDALARQGGDLGLHGIVWPAGDLALYSAFLMVGFLHRDGAFRTVPRRGWIGVAVLAAAAAVAWRLTQPVPLGVVNNSHPLHLFVGTAWLAIALASTGALGRLAGSRLAGAAIRAISRRSLSIYLWHTVAIVAAVKIVEAAGITGPVTHGVALVLLTALGTLAAVQLFGWIEDVAARRPRRPEPARQRLGRLNRRVLLLITLVAVASTTLATGDPADEASAATSSRRPPIPSQAPEAPTFAEPAPPADAPHPGRVTAETVPGLRAKLDGLLAPWSEGAHVSGAVVGITGTGFAWSGAIGVRPDTGRPLSVKDRIDLASLTKLYTANLVHRLAEDGLINLAGPLPRLRSLPDFPYGARITVNHLLEHRSGLLSYGGTDLYRSDSDAIDGPISAVMASVAHPLIAKPGAVYSYSSTNYLVLGLLLEQVTGRSYDELLQDMLLKPLGLHDTIHMAPGPGAPRSATGGIQTDLSDLLRAGGAILRDHVGLSPLAFAHMTDIDAVSGFGPGTAGFCPCRIDDAGAPQFFAVGYYGVTALVAYVPTLDITVGVDLVDSLGSNGGFAEVTALFEMIDDLAPQS